MVAILSSLLVSYARARAEGLGLDCKVGIAQRAERILGLGVASLLVGAGPRALVLEAIVALLARRLDHHGGAAVRVRLPQRRPGDAAEPRLAQDLRACRARSSRERTLAVAEQTARQIAPAQGKLGVLCVGLGAVATTFIAGVENVRRGAARPIGSLTQMGTIRLGKRTEDRAPLIKDFVPLADLDDLVFGAWDPMPDDAYDRGAQGRRARPARAHRADRRLPQGHQADAGGVRPVLREAARGHATSSRAKTKRELAEALRKDIRDFKAKQRLRPAGHGLVRLDRDLHQPGPAH